MTPCYLVMMLVTAVACLSCSQAFAPVRHRHVFTSDELLGNRDSNSPTRRKQQLVPRREGGLRTLRLHGPSDAKWCSSDGSSRDNYQGNCMDNDLFEVMTRLDFGVGLTAAGVSMLFGAVPKQASADEIAAVSETVRDPSPVVTEMASQPAEEPSLRDLGFEVSYTGKSLPLSKFLGSKATLVVNSKIDDPESLNQMPGITKLATEYGNEGLNVLLFPTDQGTFEADEDRVVRIKLYQFYGFGQYPRAVVFDKVDIVGNTIHPFYRYLCRALKNPNGIARITLNYEKFLLDKDGRVLRRYPRRLQASDFEQDVKATLAEQPLPAETRDYKAAWLKADQEASKSEYAFKLGLNYYNN